MIPPLTPADITLLREALNALRTADNHAINLVARQGQSAVQTRHLVMLGDRQQHMRLLDCQLRDELARRTGAPAIQHGNTDLRSESALYPLTREQEAQEANNRG